MTKKVKDTKSITEVAKNAPGVVQKDSPRIKELKYKSRVNSIRGGIFTSMKTSLGDYYLSPFAVAINSSAALVASLSSISGLLGPLSQMFGSRLLERSSRKKIFLKSTFFEALAWIPLISLAVLYWIGVIPKALPLIFLLFFSVYVILLNVSIPTWFSWTGDLINEKYRGRWFSKRGLFVGFVSVIFAIVSSLMLDSLKKANLLMLGFIILFALALALRLVARRFYKNQYEPKFELKKGDYFSFFSFLLQARKTNFGRFSFFSSLLHMAVAVASPFFVVYMLRDLHFNYLLYMIVTFSGVVFSLLVIELWGKISDRFGNYTVLSITTLLIPLVPLLWIFSSNPVYLIFVPTLISGISWAGFNLASGNFVYDNVRNEKRGLAVSYYNMLSGIGVFIGAGIGAILVKFLTVSFMDTILFIFLISGILRIVVSVIFLPMFKEVRNVKRGSLSNTFFHQLKPSVLGEFHEILSIRRYLGR